MPLDFPATPTLNESWSAPNGVIYTWDGTKWTLKIQADELLNFWQRNAINETLYPKSFNDEILFSNLGIQLLDSLPE